jgi:hypothetical protein
MAHEIMHGALRYLLPRVPAQVEGTMSSLSRLLLRELDINKALRTGT